MKLLFIGGTGNISSAVSRLVLSQGHELSLLNRGRSAAVGAGAELIRADINEGTEVASRLRGRRWDAVVNWIAFTPADIQRDLALFRGAAGQYVFISSATVYRKPPEHPVITESTPLGNPHWQYAREKIACEEALGRAAGEEGFPVTVVRPSHTYQTVIPTAVGGWEDWGMVERIRRGGKVVVPGDGTSLWTLTHADDFARGFAGLLGNPKAVGEAFHITSDELLTWNQIYGILAEAAGSEARIVHMPSELIARLEPSQEGTLLGDKAHSVIFDNSKIRSLVPEFRAAIPFREGIRRTLAWFEAAPERRKNTGETDRLLDRLLAAYGQG